MMLSPLSDVRAEGRGDESRDTGDVEERKYHGGRRNEMYICVKKR